ncbi:MAG TPA: ATP-grasp domain-containing protein [Gemmataceae bacterium]|nr:ATP-grasp domain-containing protein [Gemmataceae bacterium]
MVTPSRRVLVAGIGGASLGTELLKCLKAVDRYTIFGCDVSNLAAGHYAGLATETFLADRARYVDSVLDICHSQQIDAVIPGGEEPLQLLGRAGAKLKAEGIFLAANSPSVIATCSDKNSLFERLRELEIPVPWTLAVENLEDFEARCDIPYPCVIKPATGTGGSVFVTLVTDRAEALMTIKPLLTHGRRLLVQEYVPLDEGGEFTVGVLCYPNGHLVGSVAMQRVFHTKLSVLTKTTAGLISTGYSQGLIQDFPDLQSQCEKIARALGSVGPMNIQGRLRQGLLLPFEVNPRFSASTYLRALAGFNEVDIFLRHWFDGEVVDQKPVRAGYYLRNLSELYVPLEEVKG